MIKLAGPMAVSPMEAARYTISGVPNFPERKDHLTELGYGVLDKVGNEIITDEDIGAKAQKNRLKEYIALTKLDKELVENYEPLNFNKGGVVHAKDGYMGYHFPVPSDMNMPSDERKMEAKIIGDKIKERRKNIYNYLTDINPLGHNAFERLQDEVMENKYPAGKIPVPADMNMPSDERKMQAKIVADKRKEKRKNMYEYLTNIIIDRNPFGSAARERLQDDAMEGKYLDENTGVYIPYYDVPSPSYYNVGGYAEEQNPIVSLAGEYAETTPMPAPDYKNIDAPQTQGGGGSSTGNMAKNMAMKMGMKMAANAILPGSGMIFNRGGHVPQYANEGVMRAGYEDGPAFLRPFAKKLDNFFNYNRYPNEDDGLYNYYSELGDQLQDKPPVSFWLSPLLNKLGVGAQDSSGFDYGQMPIDDSPYEKYHAPIGNHDYPMYIAPPDGSGYEGDINAPPPKHFWGLPPEPIEENLEELKRQEAIDNENKFKGLIEKGYIDGAGYANRGGHVGPPMTKEYIRKLMS